MWRANCSLFRSIVSSILADKSQVEDALQEAFAKVFRSGRQFGSEAQAFCFIRKAVYNASIDQLRRTTRRNKRFQLSDDPVRHDRRAGEGSDDPLSHLVRAEVRGHRQTCLMEVKKGMRQLSPAQRQAIRLMFDRNGRPIKKTCQELGIPYSTVRSRMLAAIQVLRRRLAAKGLLDEHADPHEG